MSVETERRTLEKLLRDNWTTTPIQYDNVPFKQPSDKKWITLTIVSGDGARLEVGGPPYTTRYIGVIMIQIFTPAGRGTATAKRYATSLSNIYRNKTLTISANEYILTREPDFVRGGVEQSTGLYQMNVNIPFWRDITHTT